MAASTASRRARRFALLSTPWSTLLLSVLLVGGAQADPAAWLMKINRAASSLSFSGVFVHSHDGDIEATQVVRRVKDEMLQERLYSLSGERREIVRDRARIWCYIPAEKVGVHDYRQVFDSGFPRIDTADLQQLKRNYRFTEGGLSRIANRMAQRIDIIPNDGYRYGYRLWADVDTGLLLRSDLIGGDNKVVEKYLFVTIDVDRDISDHELQAVTPKEKLVWYGKEMPQPDAPASSTLPDARHNWKVEPLPAGYRLSKYMRRTSPLQGGVVEHLMFTDGLSTVSVFIKRARPGQSAMQGLTRMGAVHAYRSAIDNYRITVMGEAPARTVEHLAAGVGYAH